ncbi:hypothetical protein HBA55_11990 [Pseudomaricurvus alkylphenolicus]|uniref:hypothetical protein n=1 Tax=Pseudomaricurvus alkylphenolicus TaxID=1306991 RepID=UPI001420A413|nr:hypothetical protein [Pseudomaricurvus alkylphenolicus]NIB40312.1 hypothetical protein [Pseudomaricurvus alkylphenolicus]
MDRISAWRFINPPMAWAQGIIVNQQGKRYCNEQVYGARLGYFMIEKNDGRALLILNKSLFKRAIREVDPGKLWLYQWAPALMNMYFNAEKANTLKDLAEICQLPTLQTTVDAYNRAARGEQED